MVYKTRRIRKSKSKRPVYRHKTQKGGFTPALISNIANQISSRLGPILATLLQRAQVSGSVPLATQTIAETGSVAAEALSSALRQAVGEAVSRNPQLADSANVITNEILTSAAARLSASSSVTAGSTAGATAAALASAAGAALSASATAVGAVLASLFESSSRLNPDEARALVSVFQTSVLPAVQRGVQSVLRRGVEHAAEEKVLTVVRPAPSLRTATRTLSPLIRGPGGLTGRQRFAHAAVALGSQPRRAMSSVANTSVGNASRARANAARAANASGANTSSAAQQAAANAAGNSQAAAAPAKIKIYTDKEINSLSRDQLKRLYEEYRAPGVGPLTAPPGREGTTTMREFVKKTIMPQRRAEYAASTGRNTPPPLVPQSVPQTIVSSPNPLTNLVTETAIQENNLEGGAASQGAQINRDIQKATEQNSNNFDLIFTPAPIFTEAITDPVVMARLVAEIPEVPDNAASLLPELLSHSAVGKAIQAVQLTTRNVQYYRAFGRMVVDAGHVVAYNRNVEESMRLLLSRAPKEDVQNLFRAIPIPQMQAFRTGLFDLFLSAPRDAMRTLQTIVGQILPHNLLTPAAFDIIVTTLQQTPDNLPVVLERIVRERAAAEQEVSFATRLWRSRGAGQTTGRYGVLGVGVIGVLFLAALYGFSNPYELIFILRNELSTFGLNDVLSEGINSLDRFYDALNFAVLGRNAERVISTGVVGPAASTIQAVRTYWSEFIQAGHPRTLFEILIENLNSILDTIGRNNAMLFTGATLMGIVIYRARQAAIEQDRTLQAGLPPPPPSPPSPGNTGPEPRGNNPSPPPVGNNTNSPRSNLPPRALRPRENFGVAALGRSRANLEAAGARLPPNTNNW